MSLNLNLLKEYQREQIVDIFKGNKKYVLCIDGDLEWLVKKTLGGDDVLNALPDNVVQFHVTSDPVFEWDAKERPRVVFVVQSRLPVLKRTVEHIKNLVEKYKVTSRDMRVYIVPRRTLIAEHVFDVEGVKDVVGDLCELDLDLAVVEDNVLSMGLERAAEELLVENERCLLYSVAKSIVKMMLVFGKPEHMKWKGTHSDLVGKLIDQMTMETSDLFTGQSSSLHTIMLLDRSVDLMTPMLTEGTYAGSLRENYTVTDDVLEPPVEIIDPNQKQVEEIPLTTADPIYKALRDRELTGIQHRLHRAAVKVQDKYDKRSQLKTAIELKGFLDTLPALEHEKRCLAIHLELYADLRKATTTADARNHLDTQKQIAKGDADKTTIDTIESMMYKGEDVPTVMRVISLYSQCGGGLKGKLYEGWKAVMVEMHGLQVLEYWERLERARVLVKAETGRGNPFANIRKELKLWEEGYTSSSVHRVYQGHAPVVAKLMQRFVSGSDWNRSWAGLRSPLSLLPGPAHPDLDLPPTPDPLEKGKTRNVLLFFIGGITHSEIAALRIIEEDLAADEDVPPVQFVIATTSIITGGSFVEALTGHRE